MLERCQLTEIITVAIEAVDERQTIAVRAQLPKAVLLQIQQLARL